MKVYSLHTKAAIHMPRLLPFVFVSPALKGDYCAFSSD